MKSVNSEKQKKENLFILIWTLFLMLGTMAVLYSSDGIELFSYWFTTLMFILSALTFVVGTIYTIYYVVKWRKGQ